MFIAVPLAAPAALVVAHHAAFDRKFAERFSDVFKTKALH